MTSPELSDQKPRVDPVDGLRVFVADLRALADRLELKARSHNLQPTLKALDQRVSGPRAVVMLLSKHEELKRRFLERLLGPKLPNVPMPVTDCIRLEYGAAMERLRNDERADQASERTIETMRLPNATLKSGLAVIDTPALEGGEPDARVLAYAEQADLWILVLNADHKMDEASQALLRRLPENGARLEIVIENAETLSGGERVLARDRLLETLRGCRKMEAPRLTLVAAEATEGDEASFWHGRFATFHSVMMLRAREHWLELTRSMAADALSNVTAEIEFELRSIALGLRHAQLRLGMQDLEGLQTRFQELGCLDGNRSLDAGAAQTTSEMVKPRARLAAADAANAGMTAAEPGARNRPVFTRARKAGAGLDTQGANSSEELARPILRGKSTLLKGAAGMATIGLIAWALSPKGFFFAQERGAAWDYHSPQPAPISQATSATAKDANVDLPKPSPAPLPDTAAPAPPNIASAPPVKRHARLRLPLPRPIPSGATAGAAPPTKRHHRHLLGLGKLWHWMRHGHGQHDAKTE